MCIEYPLHLSPCAKCFLSLNYPNNLWSSSVCFGDENWDSDRASVQCESNPKSRTGSNMLANAEHESESSVQDNLTADFGTVLPEAVHVDKNHKVNWLLL